MGKREDIVTAAVDLIQERGFAKTRVEDICRKAGIAKGTYYLYFSTRDDVAGAIFEQVIAAYSDRAERLTLNRRPDGDAVAGVSNAARRETAGRLLCGEIRSLGAEARTRLKLVPLLFSVLAERVATGDRAIARQLSSAFARLAASWATLLAEAGVPDADSIARTLVSLVDGVVLHAALFDDPFVSLDRAIESACTIVNSITKDGGIT